MWHARTELPAAVGRSADVITMPSLLRKRTHKKDNSKAVVKTISQFYTVLEMQARLAHHTRHAVAEKIELCHYCLSQILSFVSRSIAVAGQRFKKK